MKKGKITPNGVVLREHEMSTVVFLTELGYNIELIPKSNKHGEHTPDIKFLNQDWEMKSPIGKGNSVIKNTFQKAAKQAENLIIDLRRVKRHSFKCIREIDREFKYSRGIKRVKVITKSKQVIDFEK